MAHNYVLGGFNHTGSLVSACHFHHFNVGDTATHNCPYSAIFIGIDAQNLAIFGVGRIEISVTHKALLFVSFIGGVGVGAKDAV